MNVGYSYTLREVKLPGNVHIMWEGFWLAVSIIILMWAAIETWRTRRR